MNEDDISKIPVDLVLSNVSDELTGLCGRLRKLETLIFEENKATYPSDCLRNMQDMDLIIQQISDLSKTILCITELELEGITVSTAALTASLHLKDLRERLVGVIESNGNASNVADVQLF